MVVSLNDPVEVGAGPIKIASITSPRPRRARESNSWPVRLLQLGVLILIFGGWQLAATLNWISPAFTSSPSRFFPAFWHGMTSNTLPPLMGTTLFETFVGFAVGSALGIVMGILMAEFKVLNLALRPFMTGFNALPRIALAPLFVLWFGLGSMSRIVLIVSLGFFIVTFNTYAGMQSCDRDRLLLAKVLGATRWERFTKFVLPSAVPSIFTGLQLNLSYAFLGAVVGEMLSGSQGLGGYLALQMGSFDIDAFFGALVLLVIVALVCSMGMRLIESRLLRWRAIELRGVQGAA